MYVAAVKKYCFRRRPSEGMLVNLVYPVGEKAIVAHFHSAHLSQSVAQSEEERHANPFVPRDRKNKATDVHHALPDFDRRYDILHILIKTTGGRDV